MDQVHAGERGPAGSRLEPETEALEFVRFCHRRRRVGWPELYDEMCAVAGRGLYHGYAADDLGRIGIGFALDQMPGLATIVHEVVAEDHERRRLTAQAVRASYVEAAVAVAPVEAEEQPIAAAPSDNRTKADTSSPEIAPRLVALAAGA